MIAGKSPQLYHGHEELRELLRRVFLKLLLTLKHQSRLVSSPPLLRLAASGGYFALFHLSSLLLTSPLPQLQPESTFSGPLRQSAAGLEERTRIHGKKTLTLSLQRRVAPSFYCCVSVDWTRWGVYSSLAGHHRKALCTSGIWNGL